MAFSQEVADAICERLTQGLSLRKACLEVEGAKAPTILLWVDSYPAFAEQYTRARLLGYRLLADEILEISDDGKGDSWTDDEGIVRTNNDVIARSRLRVDSRKWMLSKMLPKVYGDKIETTHTGEININTIERRIVDPQA